MSNHVYCGIDNGVTGSISIITKDGEILLHTPMPVKRELSYTKQKQYITRIDRNGLFNLLTQNFDSHTIPHVIIERPMVNPTRFKASASALRALESTLNVLEDLKISYSYIDSRIWQAELLPKGVEGPELKKAAVDVARRLFPTVQTKDADSLLIAEYARMTK